MSKSKVEGGKLPKKFKKDWLKALRSGNYKQGESELRASNNTYCCLGVAAHIAGCKSITSKGWIENTRGLSQPIRGIIKVPEILRGTKGIPRKLANMNDRGKTFKQIANYIEKNL